MYITPSYQLNSFDLRINNRPSYKNPNFGNKEIFLTRTKKDCSINDLASEIKGLIAHISQYIKIAPSFKNSNIDKQIKKFMKNKPVFGTYTSKGEKSIKSVSMAHYLTVNATEKEEYIGTTGLGPCIGIAIVNKKDEKPLNMSIAHIAACTDMNTLDRLFYAMKDPSELYITLISADNETWVARDILYKLLTSNVNKKIKNISINLACSDSDLEFKRSTNFAVNTKTGEICVNLPHKDFNCDETCNDGAFPYRYKYLQKSSHQTLPDIIKTF